MGKLPGALVDAVEVGELSADQLQELITAEAKALGLTFDEAVRAAKDGTLPKNLIGSDLSLLVDLLEAA
jgi:hypothetical protein